MESALSAKGRVTIPKAIRDHLHLEPGDRIKFFMHPDGSVVILPKVLTSSLKGMVRSRRRKVSLGDIEEAPTILGVKLRTEAKHVALREAVALQRFKNLMKKHAGKLCFDASGE